MSRRAFAFVSKAPPIRTTDPKTADNFARCRQKGPDGREMNSFWVERVRDENGQIVEYLIHCLYRTKWDSPPGPESAQMELFP